VADIKEVLVAWDAGESVSGIARMFGYTRPTVRKYVHAAESVGLTRGGGRRGEAEWERLTRAAMDRVARRRAGGPAATEVAEHRDYLDKHVGTVHLSVLYQRLRDERGLRASWRTFHRYVRAQWPERMRGAPAATVRLDDPAPGEEAQVDFFYVGLWHDPRVGRRRKLYAFLMTLSHSRHQFLYPVLAEDATAWHEGHVKGVAFFGGVPRRVVPDNLSAGIRKADRYDPRINRAYGELARHYGFLVDPARAAHPTDKPKVDRGVSYARASFFAGRDFASLEGMRAAALQSKKSVTAGCGPWSYARAARVARAAASAADQLVVPIMCVVALSGTSVAQEIEPSGCAASGTRSLCPWPVSMPMMLCKKKGKGSAVSKGCPVLSACSAKMSTAGTALRLARRMPSTSVTRVG
jgi:transposase